MKMSRFSLSLLGFVALCMIFPHGVFANPCTDTDAKCWKEAYTKNVLRLKKLRSRLMLQEKQLQRCLGKLSAFEQFYNDFKKICLQPRESKSKANMTPSLRGFPGGLRVFSSRSHVRANLFGLLKHLYQKIDADNSGSISHKESNSYQIQVTELKWYHFAEKAQVLILTGVLFDKADANKDRQIDTSEIMRMFAKIPPSIKDSSGRIKPEITNKLFKDLAGNFGKITRSSIEQFAKKMRIGGYPKRLLVYLSMAIVDTDQNDKISRAEFGRVVKDLNDTLTKN